MIPTNTADVAPRAAPSTLVSGFHFAAFPDAGVPGEGYWRRAFARIIDLILLELVEWIALVIVAAPAVAFAARMGTPGELLLERLGRTTLASTVLGMAGLVAYFTLFEWLWGSTPGKRLLGLVVVTEDLAPCPAGAALTRIGKKFWTLTSHIEDQAGLQKLADWIAAAGVVRRLKTTRIGTIAGTFEGATDMMADQLSLRRYVGPVCWPIEPETVASAMEAISDTQVQALVKAEAARLLSEADITAEKTAKEIEQMALEDAQIDVLLQGFAPRAGIDDPQHPDRIDAPAAGRLAQRQHRVQVRAQGRRQSIEHGAVNESHANHT